MRKFLKIIFQIAVVFCVACINGNIDSWGSGGFGNYQTFLYVAKNSGTSNIGVFQMGTSGDLTSVGSTTVPSTLNSLVYVSSGPFLYVGSNTGSIYGYSIDRSSGLLTALGGFPVSTVGVSINSMCADPSGKFVYAVNNISTNNVYGFTINSSNGSLTAMAGNPFNLAGGTVLKNCAIDSSGKFFFAHNASAGASNIFSNVINPSTGDLTAAPGSPYTLGFIPAQLAVDPQAKFVFVVTSDPSNGLNLYSINTGTGQLTVVGGYAVPGGFGKANVAITPSGSYLYVTINTAANNMYGFTYNPSTGVPTIINGGVSVGTAGTTASIVSPTIESTSAYYYSLDTGIASAYGFYINSSGLLSPLSGGPVLMTTTPRQITFARVRQ